MRRDTRQRKRALAGLRAISGQDEMLGTLVRVISSGKQALDAVMLEMGRMVAESVMLMEREEVAGPDYYPTDPAFKKWAHEEGSLYLGDQKVKVTRPRLRHVEQGEVTLQSYARLRAPGAFSEELLEKILRGVSAQKYAETVLQAGEALGVSPSTVSRKLVDLTATKLKEFQERSLADVHAVRDLSRHDPPGRRGVSRRAGRGRERGEDGFGVLARRLGESRDL